jgi:hypothetical protein
MEPVGPAPRPVAVDLDDDVGDVVAADGRTQAGGRCRLIAMAEAATGAVNFRTIVSCC